jgi:hypothetical protein
MLEMDMAGLLKNVVMLLQVDFVLYFYALQDQMRSSRAFEFFDVGLLLKRQITSLIWLNIEIRLAFCQKHQ